jgi:hypothetical protein
MDIGAIVKGPLQDKDWLSKCLIIGLIMLVPIAGSLNALGWTKTVYENLENGDTSLPPGNFNYIGKGWTMFLALLGPILALFGLAILVGVAAAVTRSQIVGMLGQLVLMVLNLGFSFVLYPTLSYRHLTENTGFGDAFDFGGIMATVGKPNFVMFAVCYFVGGLIGSLGMVACCLGIFLTLPLGMAIHAHAARAFKLSTAQG